MRPLRALMIAVALAVVLGLGLALSAWRAVHADDVAPLAALDLPRAVVRYDLAYWRHTRATDHDLWQAAVARCATATPRTVNCEPVRALLALDHLEAPAP